MKADALIARLDKARATGKSQWVACCPAHQDKHPSMTIRELDDERVLVHCFAGCDVEQILAAIGMSFDALFPDKALDNRLPPLRRPFPAADVLECLERESQIVVIAAATVAAGDVLSEEDRQRLTVATSRISNGRVLANG